MKNVKNLAGYLLKIAPSGLVLFSEKLDSNNLLIMRTSKLNLVRAWHSNGNSSNTVVAVYDERHKAGKAGMVVFDYEKNFCADFGLGKEDGIAVYMQKFNDRFSVAVYAKNDNTTVKFQFAVTKNEDMLKTIEILVCNLSIIRDLNLSEEIINGLLKKGEI